MANQTTEEALFLTRAQRREVQARLNASGNNVGGTDGIWGPKTRGGIRAWQAANGLTPTGHMNALQLQLLRANTEVAYQAYLAARPAATAGRPKQTTSRPSAPRPSSSNNRPRINPDAIVGGVIGGVVGGIISRNR